VEEIETARTVTHSGYTIGGPESRVSRGAIDDAWAKQAVARRCNSRLAKYFKRRFTTHGDRRMAGIKGEFTEDNVTFKYGEVSYGTNRGIRISAGTRVQDYRFSPNPHDDPWYNKNQAKFYLQAAHAIAKLYLESGNQLFPRYGATIDVENVVYALLDR